MTALIPDTPHGKRLEAAAVLEEMIHKILFALELLNKADEQDHSGQPNDN